MARTTAIRARGRSVYDSTFQIPTYYCLLEYCTEYVLVTD